MMLVKKSSSSDRGTLVYFATTTLLQNPEDRLNPQGYHSYLAIRIDLAQGASDLGYLRRRTLDSD